MYFIIKIEKDIWLILIIILIFYASNIGMVEFKVSIQLFKTFPNFCHCKILHQKYIFILLTLFWKYLIKIWLFFIWWISLEVGLFPPSTCLWLALSWCFSVNRSFQDFILSCCPRIWGLFGHIRFVVLFIRTFSSVV